MNLHPKAYEVARILLRDLDTYAAAIRYARTIERNARANGHADMAQKYGDAARALDADNPEGATP
jgi:hypothetical protein